MFEVAEREEVLSGFIVEDVCVTGGAREIGVVEAEHRRGLIPV